MTYAEHIIDRIRQPEYTGENRCPPCTAVNLLIAAAISGLFGLQSTSLMVGSFALFVGVIYFRGYLVPGTPTLTKRYLPDRVLRLFDKQPMDATTADGAAAATDWGEEWMEDGMVDPERLLCDVGALTECESGDDLCLTDEFRDAWLDRIDRLGDGDEREILSAVLDTTVAESELAVEDTDSAFGVEYDGERGFYHGYWESRAAFVADMATDQELQARAERWGEADLNRLRLVEGLRVFLERCPDCGGAVATTEEEVESCCFSRSVLATTCEECGSRLFEFDLANLE